MVRQGSPLVLPVNTPADIVVAVEHLEGRLQDLSLLKSNEEKQEHKSNSNENKSPATVIVTPTPHPQPDVVLKLDVESTSKHQHFSREYLLWAIKDGRTAGNASARYIDRSRLKKMKVRSLYKAVETFNGGESDGRNYALDLFYENGQLMDKHKTVGPWGNELSSGAVLILGLIMIDRSSRRQGIARLMLQALIEKAKKAKGGCEFMVVYPGTVPRDVRQEIESRSAEEQEVVMKKAYDNAVGFYRSVGFRRIGLSGWLGLALDEKHPARQIAAGEDPNPA